MPPYATLCRLYLRCRLPAGAEGLDDDGDERDQDDRRDDVVEVALDHRLVAEEVAGEEEGLDPDQATQDVPDREAPVGHAADAGDEGGEGAHDGHEAGE